MSLHLLLLKSSMATILNPGLQENHRRISLKYQLPPIWFLTCLTGGVYVKAFVAKIFWSLQRFEEVESNFAAFSSPIWRGLFIPGNCDDFWTLSTRNFKFGKVWRLNGVDIVQIFQPMQRFWLLLMNVLVTLKWD